MSEPRAIPWKKLTLMMAVALALRLTVIFFLFGGDDPGRFDAIKRVEPYRVAQAVADGRGFSSPFAVDTGPTAFLAPAYPLVAGSVFKLFPGSTAAGTMAVLALNSLGSSLACLTVFFLGLRLFEQETALATAWCWAFCPYAVYFSTTQFWDTDWTPLLITSLLLLTLRLAEAPSALRWAAFGALWAVTGLTTSALLVVLPVTGLWAAWQLRRARKDWIAGAILAAAVFALAVSPWMMRNARRFDAFIPFRSNLPLELSVGNSVETEARWRGWRHPNENRGELHQYVRLGESAYMAGKQREFGRFLAEHPGAFAWLTLKRAAYMWTGVWDLRPRYLWALPLEAINIFPATALTLFGFAGLRLLFRENAPAGWLLLLVLLFLPAMYYVTHVNIRYRHPLDPLLLLLGTHTVARYGRAPLRGLPPGY